MPRLIILLLILSCQPLAQAADAPGVSDFRSDSEVATSGFFRLSWQSGAEVELQEWAGADPQAARPVYKGTDEAYFVSGKPDGTYGYRIRTLGEAGPSSWAGPVVVTVRHHSLTRAWMFFALGAFVFLSILILIVRPAGRTP